MFEQSKLYVAIIEMSITIFEYFENLCLQIPKLLVIYLLTGGMQNDCSWRQNT